MAIRKYGTGEIIAKHQEPDQDRLKEEEEEPGSTEDEVEEPEPDR